MKYFLHISNIFEDISTLSHSIVFLYYFVLITEEAFILLIVIIKLIVNRIIVCEKVCFFSSVYVYIAKWTKFAKYKNTF